MTTDIPPQSGRKRRRTPFLSHSTGRAAALAASLLLISSLQSSDDRPTPSAMYAEAATAGVRAANHAPPSLRKNGGKHAAKKQRPAGGSAATGERISVVVQPENFGRGAQHLIPDSGSAQSGWRRLLPFGTSQSKPNKKNHKPPRKGGVEATFDEWLQYQNEMNSNLLGDASANNVLSYDEWLEAQSQATRRQSTGNYLIPPHMGDSVSYEEWLSAQSDNVQSSFGYGSSRGRARGSSSGSQQSASRADYESWLQSQSEAVSSGLLGDSGYPSYNEWLEMMSSSSANLSQEDYESWLVSQTHLQNSVTNSSSMGLSPVADVDTVGGKQIILRPRLADGSQLSLPALGSSMTSQGDQPTVFYYDPSALQATSSEREEAPELTLPTVVYDASGRALSMSSVHAGGRNQVFLEVRPKSTWGDGIKSQMSNLSSKLNLSASSLDSSRASAAGGSDQLIVLVTLATTAVVVGMLAARRLRSRRLLEDCFGLEDDDENDRDVGRNKKYDADTGLSVAGSSIAGGSGFMSTDGLMGGRGAGGYYGTATPGGGNGLHWRGDSDKFDV